MPYNLGSDVAVVDETDRVFDVAINGSEVLNNFDIRNEEGPCRAVIRKFTVDVADGRGLSIDFTPVKGKPVLNAIRIYRCL